ncbi:hypothetical protein PHLH4_30040 [Pseudomonas sp. St316]|nr:hypothetical protein PHLH4_30040 [Pseudomonas sp. St316]
MWLGIEALFQRIVEPQANHLTLTIDRVSFWHHCFARQ